MLGVHAESPASLTSTFCNFRNPEDVARIVEIEKENILSSERSSSLTSLSPRRERKFNNFTAGDKSATFSFRLCSRAARVLALL